MPTIETIETNIGRPITLTERVGFIYDRLLGGNLASDPLADTGRSVAEGVRSVDRALSESTVAALGKGVTSYYSGLFKGAGAAFEGLGGAASSAGRWVVVVLALVALIVLGPTIGRIVGALS